MLLKPLETSWLTYVGFSVKGNILKDVQTIDSLSLSPQGHLQILNLPDNLLDATTGQVHDKKIVKAFLSSQEQGLLALLAANVNDTWSNALKFWRQYIGQYAHRLCHYSSEAEALIEKIAMPEDLLENVASQLPPMFGAEYGTTDILSNIWTTFDDWVREKIQKEYQGLGDFLAKELPFWHQIGRVCFHLAENKQDNARPFAFIATYAAAISSHSKVQYQPLGKALQVYAGKQNKKALSKLLKPICEAAKQCDWLNALLESHDIYHPLVWTPEEAYFLLKSVPILEEAGVVVKLPNWWQKRAKPKVQVTIGNTQKSHFGAEALLNFDVNVAIDGKPLTARELKVLQDSPDGLAFLRGQWVELDKDKLQEALTHWEDVQKDAGDGLSFIEGMRLLAGINQNIQDGALEESLTEWCGVEATKEVRNILQSLRNPEMISANLPGKGLSATLRHYQESGVAWLDLLTELGLGACLADDMGLGKTIQVIALLLMKKQKRASQKGRAQNGKSKNAKAQNGNTELPNLLVLPASLLSNWQAEILRFAPSLKMLILHGSEQSRDSMAKIAKQAGKGLKQTDLVITTYGMLSQQDWLKKVSWHLIILDEAQAIKNPSSKKTQSAKKLSGKARIALTGTPVENRVGDLWSLFDFLCPGLLGGSTRFKQFIKSLESAEHVSYAPLRQLVSPYILRRLKTDKKIISDLPDKTEVDAWCGLSRQQAKLYAQSVEQMGALLETTEGMKRRGLVLSFLTKFKQICNHPSQFMGDGEFTEKLSGKFARLREICEEISARQEKVLIFTQYREMTRPLQRFLEEIFQQTGLVLHGGTPVKQRQKLVDNFQSERGSPFFVLSLKAAGVGLNLTAASHVVHFDRWWNPAVENQATDRAYRIGQKKNVLVHKFICKGTVEEKIHTMIEEKKALANDLLEGGGEAMLTEMNDEQLLNLVALDIEQTNL